MADFTQDIKNFVSNGNFTYQFDEAGNVVLNPSSSVFQENYLSLTLAINSYDKVKILSFYNPAFTEFQKTEDTGSNQDIPQDVVDQINLITQQNQDLQGQLDQLVARSEVTSSFADEIVIKDIVISLRIQLGQGASESDFNDDFPYLPIPLDQRDTAPTT